MPKILVTPMTIHDRKSADLPINAVVVPFVIDDPYSDSGEKIEVLRSIRNDILAGMLSRRHIEPHQYEAGRLWEKYFEQAQIGGLSAIDPTREVVDGGKMREPITDIQVSAFRKLNEARTELGRFGHSLVMDILGLRCSLIQAAERRNCWTETDRKFIARSFRNSLDGLAVLWQLASK